MGNTPQSTHTARERICPCHTALQHDSKLRWLHASVCGLGVRYFIGKETATACTPTDLLDVVCRQTTQGRQTLVDAFEEGIRSNVGCRVQGEDGVVVVELLQPAPLVEPPSKQLTQPAHLSIGQQRLDVKYAGLLRQPDRVPCACACACACSQWIWVVFVRACKVRPGERKREREKERKRRARVSVVVFDCLAWHQGKDGQK